METIDNLREQVQKLIDEGKYQEAILLYKEILDIDPDDHQSWYYLSITYVELKKYKEAEEALRKAVALDDENTDYYLQLGYLTHMDEKIEESIEIFDKILELDPTNIDANIMLGIIAKEDERYEEAIDFFEDSIIKEIDAEALINLIECYLNIEDLENTQEKLDLLIDVEVPDEFIDRENELYLRFYLDKAMETWTGSMEEDGETKYFPETLEQINDTEHYIKLAESLKTEEEYYLERISLIKNVLTINRDLIDSENSDIEELEQNSDYENLSKKDKKAWGKLEEIYYLWTDINEEDGLEYRWPATINEIKESEKIFKQIKRIRYKDKGVKERYKELYNVLKSSKTMIPNYTNKFLFSFITSVIILIGFFFLSTWGAIKKPKFDYNQNDFEIVENTNMVYDAFVTINSDSLRHFYPLSKGTFVKPVARIGGDWIQVETENGNLGFVNYKTLKGAENAIIKKTMPLYTDYKNKIIQDSVRIGDKVTILSYETVMERFPTFLSKIKTSSGRTGTVVSHYLDLPFRNILPVISQTSKFPTTLKNIKQKVIGSNLSYAEKKYGPASSIISTNNKRIAYFRQITITKDKTKFRGIFFTLDNNKIVDYELNKKIKYNLLEKLPLAHTMRSLESFDLLQFSYYNGQSIKFSWWGKIKSLNKFTKILCGIIQFITTITLMFLFFSIPRLIISPIMNLISYCRLFGNGFVLFLNFLFYGLITYIFFIWIALLMNQIFTPAIFVVPCFFIWVYMHRMNINYNRCPKCHTMNIGMDKGSTYHGQTEHVSWGTYDVYKGKSESGNKIISHYERRTSKSTETIDHYKDHRECIRCGYKWSVAREESQGTSTEHL